MDHDDNHTRSLQESSLGQASLQSVSTPVARNSEGDSRGDLFATLAAQFVEQVRAMASVDEPSEDDEDDDDVVLIEPDTSDTSKSASKPESSGRFRLRGVPDQVANRVVEVLRSEFGIATLDAGQLYRSNEVEMPEVKKEPTVRFDDAETRQAKARFASRLSDIMRNAVKALATKIGKTSQGCSCCKSSDLERAGASRSNVSAQNDTTPCSDSSPSTSESASSAKGKSCYQLRNRSAKSAFYQDLDSSDQESESTDSSSHSGSLDSKSGKRTRARRSLGSSSRKHLDHSHAKTSENSASTSNQADCNLWDDKIEKIYRESQSIRIFCANLMYHFFSKAELVECDSVCGRTLSCFDDPRKTSRPLDPKRISMIRQLVQLKVGPSNAIWKKCIPSMNKHIERLKLIASQPDRFAKIDKKGRYKGILFSKQNASLEKSPVYDENGLSYDEISEIYESSRTMTHFALNLMRELFTESELRECFNVYGRPKCNSLVTKRCLDKKRVELIRRIVTENCNHDKKHLWRKCIQDMNSWIVKIKRPVAGLNIELIQSST